MTATLRNPRGRPKADPFDIQNRRQVYIRLKARLSMTSRQVAELVGLSSETTRMYPGHGREGVAPTQATLDRMRQELIRRARAAVAEAEARYALEMDLAAAERRLGIGQESEAA
ncbi:hypothetical protein FJ955_02020 [Mesorhizobium sp. B2-2-2]|uniref:hypothetical protein n=1 Tax=Mesorhizobium sp. B2-2-2 TaxID=2589964 RepID=UPI001126743B|nr:hypothetical protein [Mesorhizobium sp. B2-2-2]TPM33548.1 hypothetical protein FJ955_02020 [Mesorhizobium sp. B2-2-2]